MSGVAKYALLRLQKKNLRNGVDINTLITGLVMYPRHSGFCSVDITTYVTSSHGNRVPVAEVV